MEDADKGYEIILPYKLMEQVRNFLQDNIHNIHLNDDEILKRLSIKKHLSYYDSMKEARADVLVELGRKKVILQYIKHLNRKHKNDNMLPIPILKRSLGAIGPPEFILRRPQKEAYKHKLNFSEKEQDRLLLELASDNFIRFEYLSSDYKYSDDVTKHSIDDSGKLAYFVCQTTDITEDMILNDIELGRSSFIANSQPVYQFPAITKANIPKADPAFLKSIADTFDLSDPKNRAIQRPFEINKDLDEEFREVCDKNNLKYRKCVHVAMKIFNELFSDADGCQGRA